MTTQRITWVDNAKAIGMVLVFWGHLMEQGAYSGRSEWLHDVCKAVYACHMPFFFLLAGLFYRESTVRFGVLLLRKAKSRLMPVLFFTLLSTAMWQVPEWWGQADNGAASQKVDELTGLFQGKPIANWPAWFLVCLFMTEMIASEVVPILTTRLRHLVAIAVAMAGGVFMLTDPVPFANRYFGHMDKDWWFIQTAPTTALALYLIGLFLFRYWPSLLPAATGRKPLLLIVAAGVFAGLFDRNFSDGLGMINMSGATYGEWPLFWPTALAGSFVIIHAAGYLPATRLMSFIGNNTIPLLGINGIMLWFFNPPLWQLFCAPSLDSGWVVPVSALVAVLSLLACLPLVWLLNRVVPFLIGHWK